ncbi:flavodoxin family protein [Leadbettera azotonutricia]|uniref:Flavodoxin n=1 Tax=Leadbettera azotonutricia (strain ATCC BAA-888 / DSM 13862 / ZAS-9) TaxID=545695 RepID=F5YDS6_LEAAZ|nr:flavodoxin family protein [Leadbettera azotonutricia]AEF81339.1 flavodoxin [Leadbettera azotonutricia ZAS-9]
MAKNTLLIVYSYHHMNTMKIAEIFSKKLNAKIIEPQKLNIEEIKNYDLIGFGAGIDSGKHYSPLLEIVDKISNNIGKEAFIFSTSGVYGIKKMHNDHKTLREKLESKGFNILDEFSCRGFNTNSVLKYFGGMNKGRPNEDDIKNAETFADKLGLS